VYLLVNANSVGLAERSDVRTYDTAYLVVSWSQRHEASMDIVFLTATSVLVTGDLNLSVAGLGKNASGFIRRSEKHPVRARAAAAIIRIFFISHPLIPAIRWVPLNWDSILFQLVFLLNRSTR
jgi:hypothetical protein